MAGACLVIAVGGFAPTYWLQLAPGTFVGSPLVHLHGALFTAWPVFLLLQTTFAARRRMDRHRAWGLFGISLATAMVCVGFAVANEALQNRLAAGYGDACARLSHRVVVDDRALRRIRPGSRRVRRATGDPQAADGARDDLDPPSSDRASDVCPHRGNGSRPASGSRAAANGGISDGVQRSLPMP